MPQESAYFIVERTAGKRNLQEVKAKLLSLITHLTLPTNREV